MTDSEQTTGRERADSFYLGDQGRADLDAIIKAKRLRPKVDKSKVVRDALRTVAEALGIPALQSTIADAFTADARRLRRAMARAGVHGQTSVDAAAGVSKGTTRNVLVGASLAAAGGGRLLAWVEEQERAGGAT